MRRGAESRIDTVDFPTRCPASNETKIADPFGFANAVENKRGSEVETLRGALVVGGQIEALSGHSCARYRLRRASHAPPHAAELFGETVVVLATFGHPRANAVFGPTHFNDAWQIGMVDGAPIKAIAAKINKAATLVLERRIGVEHSLGRVFGMRTGDDTLIPIKECLALGV